MEFRSMLDCCFSVLVVMGITWIVEVTNVVEIGAAPIHEMFLKIALKVGLL
jgi:hypothetical protein